MSNQDPCEAATGEPAGPVQRVPAAGPSLTRRISAAAPADSAREEDWEATAAPAEPTQPPPAGIERPAADSARQGSDSGSGHTRPIRAAADPSPGGTRAIHPSAAPDHATRAIATPRRDPGSAAPGHPADGEPATMAAEPGTRPLGRTAAGARRDDDPPSHGSVRMPVEEDAGLGIGDSSLVPQPMPEPEPSLDLDPAELLEVESPDDSGIRTLAVEERSEAPEHLVLADHEANAAPRLQPGEVLAGQYKVVGPIGRGGLGWVYLAHDRKLDDRPVVLKGLKDHNDADQRAVARAEKRHLAETNHPNLVTVYNVVEDDETDYIVMQHLAGRSLQQLLAETPTHTLPAHRAMTFTIEVLTALDYLHQRGMLHCDIKPANVMQVGGSVKVIDLGAVVRLDEPGGVIYGSFGYQAPETERGELSIQSDLYTVGRTLLRLVADVRGFDDDYADRLPDPGDYPGLHFDSLYRFLRKACHQDPARRFESAANMAGQALGIRREIAAQLRQRDGRLVPAEHAMGSARFGRPTQLIARPSWQDLPEPTLGGLAVTRELGLAHAMIGQARLQHALEVLARVTAEHPTEWRAAWLRGLIHLADGPTHDPVRAVAAFNTVYGELPGELAPKLALAYACERAGWTEMAESFYRVCVRTDAAYVPAAAFGLARLATARRTALLAAGQPDEAAVEFDRTESALLLVRQASVAWAEAAGRLAGHLAAGARRPADLARALDLIEQSVLPPPAAARLRLRVFTQAWELLEGSPPPERHDRRRLARRRLARRRPSSQPKSAPVVAQSISSDASGSEIRLDGHAFDRAGISRGLEESLRRLADLVGDLGERNALIDRANRLRQRTLI